MGTVNPTIIGQEREAEAAALGRQFEHLLESTVHRFDLERDGDVLALTLPKGRELKSLKPLFEEWRKLPERRKGTAAIADVASFIEFTRRNAGDASVIFADPSPTAPKLTAIFDYNPPGAASVEDPAAGWMQHRAQYAPGLSPEWQKWMAHNEEFMRQEEFALFIESRVGDIIVPHFDDPKLKVLGDLLGGKWAEPADLVALSRGLSVNVEVAVKQAINLPSGEIAVRYEETHTDGQGAPINVPTLFMICVPVFYRGTPYRIPVRLRYRLSGQRVLWAYQIMEPDVAFVDAFNDVVAHVKEAVDVPVFIGAPEK